jgi:cobalt/nickel transport protein
MKRLAQALVAFFVLWPLGAGAHFGVLVSSEDIVASGDPEVLVLSAAFMHPFDWRFMPMAKPRSLGVLTRGTKTDLLGALHRRKDDKAGFPWTLRYRVRSPGDHVFYMETAPYFEQAEGLFIIHYVKVVIGALGLEDGWDRPAGLPVEIVPLSRPYGLWAGNVFQGTVLRDGKPVPGAAVEVEYLNPEHKVHAPKEAMATQVIKTDANGVFTYAVPWRGWWGFSAPLRSDRTLERGGREFPVETGAVIWVRARGRR